MLQFLRSTIAKPRIKPHDDLRVGTWLRCEKPTEDEK